ncbi:MAG: phosphopantetheine-binding protein [Clostridium sp.]|jgi:acyl carrier protein|nr:phosphopantetheine-binding protein [Clostridium sp.]
MGNIKSEILDIINTNVEKAEITIEQADDDLVALGMNSISFISIVVALEATFEIEYPDECLLITQSNTLNKLANIVFDALEKKDTEGATE